MNGPYALDKGNAKLLGVCAGFARWLDVDATLVRLTMILLALVSGPVALGLYILAAWIAPGPAE